MAYSAGGVVAAAAAAKRRRMLLAEEEDMASYTQDDLRNDWEFKIVRSGTAAFRKPEVLNRLLEEEAQAGWVMLEKLDDSRIRFKRPHRARAKDAYLPDGVDPYRTQYGTHTTRQAVLVVVAGLVALALGGLGLSLTDRLGALSRLAANAPVMLILPLILIILGFLLLVKKLR